MRRSGLRVLVMGDFNTAHREIDLARPRSNRETSGFLPEERAEIDRWLEAMTESVDVDRVHIDVRPQAGRAFEHASECPWVIGWGQRTLRIKKCVVFVGRQ